MKLTFALLSLSALLALPLQAMSANESVKTNSKLEFQEDGGYASSSNSKGVAKDGTENRTKEMESVSVDDKGNTESHQRTERVSNPKGLGNEKTHTRDVRVKEKSNGGYQETVKTKDMNRAGQDVTTKSDTNVDVDNEGNVTQTTEIERSVDPKTGPFSEETTSSKTKIVNGKMVGQVKQAPLPESAK